MFGWLRAFKDWFTGADLIPHEPYTHVINNTRFTTEQIAQVFPEEGALLRQQAQAAQEHAMHVAMHGDLFNDYYPTMQSFYVDLKKQGVPKPDLEAGSILAVNPNKLIEFKQRVDTIERSIMFDKRERQRYWLLLNELQHINMSAIFKYTGNWQYDDRLSEYLIHTDYCNTYLPISLFEKMPSTLDECIDTLEKSLWSSRKSPINKKDIA